MQQPDFEFHAIIEAQSRHHLFMPQRALGYVNAQLNEQRRDIARQFEERIAKPGQVSRKQPT